MLRALRSSLLTAACGLIGAGSVWAAPITWQASGQISSVFDPSGMGGLAAIPVGTPWALEFTFDPDTPGVLLHPGSSPTYLYNDAITEARLELGTFAYTNAVGEIFINADLPIFGSSTPLGGPGLVQFQWQQGWSDAAGGPNLNLGVLLATYNDLGAVDGSLPTFPQASPVQSALNGLLWDTHPGAPGSGPGNRAQLFSPNFDPLDPLTVPEPATWLLVSTGVAAFAARRRKRHQV